MQPASSRAEARDAAATGFRMEMFLGVLFRGGRSNPVQLRLCPALLQRNRESSLDVHRLISHIATID